MGESLQISLVVLGVLVVGVVYAFNLYQDRVARKRLESAFAPKPAGQEGNQHQVVSIQESLGDGLAQRSAAGQTAAASAESVARAAEVVSDAAMPHGVTHHRPLPEADASSYAEPVASSASTHFAEAHESTSQEAASYANQAGNAFDPAPVVFDPDALPMPPVDLAVESVARIVAPEPISPTVLQAAMTIPMAKSMTWLGWSETRHAWETLTAQSIADAYRVVIISLLLVDRQGSVNDVQLNTFFRLIDNLAKNVGGTSDLPRLEAELHRALLLDRHCAEMDIQVNMSVVRSPQQGSIAATRLRGVAEACGFRWTKTGHFEFFDEQTQDLLFTLVNITVDQPFTPETLHTMQTHGVTLVLDVPNVVDPVRAFDLMRSVAKRLSSTLDAVLVDDQRRMINEGSFSAIRQTIEHTVSLMQQYKMSPGSVRTLRLFS